MGAMPSSDELMCLGFDEVMGCDPTDLVTDADFKAAVV